MPDVISNFLQVLQDSPAFFIAVSALLGLLVGSFLNVVIHRLPKMMEAEWRMNCQSLDGQPPSEPPKKFNLLTPRSCCPHCGHAITAIENIPLISYLGLRGKCRACKAPILSLIHI